MNLKVRLYFEDDQNSSFMGIGLLWLLEGIKIHGSIRKAAQGMGMSYSKAFQILKKLELSLGREILERHRGGNNRRGTSLTEYGEQFLIRYKELQNKVEDHCNAEYSDFLLEMGLKSL